MPKIQVIVSIVSVLLGTLFGFAIASASQPEASIETAKALNPVERTVGEDPNLAAILRELRGIGDRLVANSRTPSSPGESSSAREVVVPEGTNYEEVTTILDRCTTLMERLERRTASSSRGSMTTAPTTYSRKALANMGDIEYEALKAFTHEHLLLGYQQILDQYGKPDQVYHREGQVTWYYEIVGPTDTRSWEFRFADGMLISIDD